MAKRLGKRRVNQGRGRINEIRIGQETHRVYEQWNIACNPNFLPTFIRSSENPFQVSLRTNYRVYLFPLHRPIFQPMKPASDESTRETFNLIKKPPNVSSGAVSRIRPRLSPFPLLSNPVCSPYLCPRITRARIQRDKILLPRIPGDVLIPVTFPSPDAIQFFGFPRERARAEKSRWIPRWPVSENAFENSNRNADSSVLLPSPHSCNARCVCEDRSYVAFRWKGETINLSFVTTYFSHLRNWSPPRV